MHGDACANRRGSGLGRRVYRDKSKAVEMRAQTFAIGKSHPSAEAATRGAIRLFGLQTLAAPQVFYCESPSQIERAGGLELPFGTRSAASQHGGPATMCSAGTTLVPAALGGVAWSSGRTAATPGLLVIARADDVDGVTVTGIKDRADFVDNAR